ncbi:MAG: sigma-54 dependent transcriptional regulator [Dokdonella sp.]
MTSRQILVVDDEPKMRRVLEIMLQKLGHRVFSAGNGREALDLFASNAIDLVIADLRMPEMDGIELLSSLRERGSEVPLLVVTAHGTVETAVAAMKYGAFDYIVRPFDMDALLLSIERALASAALTRQNAFLREEIERGWHSFVGTSKPMQSVYDMIRRVGPSKASVFIAGETGTGKELAARAVHNASERSKKLFVPINCAAIPADLLESELFGHEKGAFTGAVKERIGKFELAEGGTVFLDELTEMPMPLQAKLLRVLQEGSLERLGSNRTVVLDIRMIAASNRDPKAAVQEGKLREDLYYRLNVFSIQMPPLRERPEDISGLVDHFIAKHGSSSRKVRLGAEALAQLARYRWPGNVRELENMVERALILSDGGVLTEQHFALDTTSPRAASPKSELHDDQPLPRLSEAVDELEGRLITAALERMGGNKARAAASLDISERALWYKLKKLRPDRA